MKNNNKHTLEQQRQSLNQTDQTHQIGNPEPAPYDKQPLVKDTPSQHHSSQYKQQQYSHYSTQKEAWNEFKSGMGGFVNKHQRVYNPEQIYKDKANDFLHNHPNANEYKRMIGYSGGNNTSSQDSYNDQESKFSQQQKQTIDDINNIDIEKNNLYPAILEDINKVDKPFTSFPKTAQKIKENIGVFISNNSRDAQNEIKTGVRSNSNFKQLLKIITSPHNTPPTSNELVEGFRNKLNKHEFSYNPDGTINLHKDSLVKKGFYQYAGVNKDNINTFYKDGSDIALTPTGQSSFITYLSNKTPYLTMLHEKVDENINNLKQEQRDIQSEAFKKQQEDLKDVITRTKVDPSSSKYTSQSKVDDMVIIDIATEITSYLLKKLSDTDNLSPEKKQEVISNIIKEEKIFLPHLSTIISALQSDTSSNTQQKFDEAYNFIIDELSLLKGATFNPDYINIINAIQKDSTLKERIYELYNTSILGSILKPSEDFIDYLINQRLQKEEVAKAKEEANKIFSPQQEEVIPSSTKDLISNETQQKEDVIPTEEQQLAEEGRQLAEEEIPTEEQQLAEEGRQLAEEEIPTEEQQLAEEEIPTEEQQLAEEEQQLAEEEIPTEEQQLAEEEIPTEEQQLAEEEQQLAENVIPTKEQQLAEEEQPLEGEDEFEEQTYLTMNTGWKERSAIQEESSTETPINGDSFIKFLNKKIELREVQKRIGDLHRETEENVAEFLVMLKFFLLSKDSYNIKKLEEVLDGVNEVKEIFKENPNIEQEYLSDFSHFEKEILKTIQKKQLQLAKTPEQQIYDVIEDISPSEISKKNEEENKLNEGIKTISERLKEKIEGLLSKDNLTAEDRLFVTKIKDGIDAGTLNKDLFKKIANQELPNDAEQFKKMYIDSLSKLTPRLLQVDNFIQTTKKSINNKEAISSSFVNTIKSNIKPTLEVVNNMVESAQTVLKYTLPEENMEKISDILDSINQHANKLDRGGYDVSTKIEELYKTMAEYNILNDALDYMQLKAAIQEHADNLLNRVSEINEKQQQMEGMIEVMNAMNSKIQAYHLTDDTMDKENIKKQLDILMNMLNLPNEDRDNINNIINSTPKSEEVKQLITEFAEDKISAYKEEGERIIQQEKDKLKQDVQNIIRDGYDKISAAKEKIKSYHLESKKNKISSAIKKLENAGALMDIYMQVGTGIGRKEVNKELSKFDSILSNPEIIKQYNLEIGASKDLTDATRKALLNINKLKMALSIQDLEEVINNNGLLLQELENIGNMISHKQLLDKIKSLHLNSPTLEEVSGINVKEIINKFNNTIRNVTSNLIKVVDQQKELLNNEKAERDTEEGLSLDITDNERELRREIIKEEELLSTQYTQYTLNNMIEIEKDTTEEINDLQQEIMNFKERIEKDPISYIDSMFNDFIDQIELKSTNKPIEEFLNDNLAPISKHLNSDPDIKKQEISILHKALLLKKYYLDFMGNYYTTLEEMKKMYPDINNETDLIQPTLDDMFLKLISPDNTVDTEVFSYFPNVVDKIFNSNDDLIDQYLLNRAKNDSLSQNKDALFILIQLYNNEKTKNLVKDIIEVRENVYGLAFDEIKNIDGFSALNRYYTNNHHSFSYEVMTEMINEIKALIKLKFSEVLSVGGDILRNRAKDTFNMIMNNENITHTQFEIREKMFEEFMTNDVIEEFVGALLFNDNTINTANKEIEDRKEIISNLYDKSLAKASQRMQNISLPLPLDTNSSMLRDRVRQLNSVATKNTINRNTALLKLLQHSEKIDNVVDSITKYNELRIPYKRKILEFIANISKAIESPEYIGDVQYIKLEIVKLAKLYEDIELHQHEWSFASGFPIEKLDDLLRDMGMSKINIQHLFELANNLTEDINVLELMNIIDLNAIFGKYDNNFLPLLYVYLFAGLHSFLLQDIGFSSIGRFNVTIADDAVDYSEKFLNTKALNTIEDTALRFFESTPSINFNVLLELLNLDPKDREKIFNATYIEELVEKEIKKILYKYDTQEYMKYRDTSTTDNLVEKFSKLLSKPSLIEEMSKDSEIGINDSLMALSENMQLPPIIENTFLTEILNEEDINTLVSTFSKNLKTQSLNFFKSLPENLRDKDEINTIKFVLDRIDLRRKHATPYNNILLERIMYVALSDLIENVGKSYTSDAVEDWMREIVSNELQLDLDLSSDNKQDLVKLFREAGKDIDKNNLNSIITKLVIPIYHATLLENKEITKAIYKKLLESKKISLPNRDTFLSLLSSAQYDNYLAAYRNDFRRLYTQESLLKMIEKFNDDVKNNKSNRKVSIMPLKNDIQIIMKYAVASVLSDEVNEVMDKFKEKLDIESLLKSKANDGLIEPFFTIETDVESNSLPTEINRQNLLVVKIPQPLNETREAKATRIAIEKVINAAFNKYHNELLDFSANEDPSNRNFKLKPTSIIPKVKEIKGLTGQQLFRRGIIPTTSLVDATIAGKEITIDDIVDQLNIISPQYRGNRYNTMYSDKSKKMLMDIVAIILRAPFEHPESLENNYFLDPIGDTMHKGFYSYKEALYDDLFHKIGYALVDGLLFGVGNYKKVTELLPLLMKSVFIMTSEKRRDIDLNTKLSIKDHNRLVKQLMDILSIKDYGSGIINLLFKIEQDIEKKWVEKHGFDYTKTAAINNPKYIKTISELIDHGFSVDGGVYFGTYIEDLIEWMRVTYGGSSYRGVMVFKGRPFSDRNILLLSSIYNTLRQLIMSVRWRATYNNVLSTTLFKDVVLDYLYNDGKRYDTNDGRTKEEKIELIGSMFKQEWGYGFDDKWSVYFTRMDDLGNPLKKWSRMVMGLNYFRSKPFISYTLIPIGDADLLNQAFKRAYEEHLRTVHHRIWNNYFSNMIVSNMEKEFKYNRRQREQLRELGKDIDFADLLWTRGDWGNRLFPFVMGGEEVKFKDIMEAEERYPFSHNYFTNRDKYRQDLKKIVDTNNNKEELEKENDQDLMILHKLFNDLLGQIIMYE